MTETNSKRDKELAAILESKNKEIENMKNKENDNFTYYILLFVFQLNFITYIHRFAVSAAGLCFPLQQDEN